MAANRPAEIRGVPSLGEPGPQGVAQARLRGAVIHRARRVLRARGLQQPYCLSQPLLRPVVLVRVKQGAAVAQRGPRVLWQAVRGGAQVPKGAGQVLRITRKPEPGNERIPDVDLDPQRLAQSRAAV